MNLTSESVNTVIRTVLLTDEEADAAGIGEEASLEQVEEHGLVMAEGVVSTFVFHAGRVAEQRDNVRSMLEDLPDSFRASSGGGWSFLNLCMTKDDVQWTGLHQTQEALCALAIATGLGKWLLPRAMWTMLPAQMPYFIYLDNEEV